MAVTARLVIDAQSAFLQAIAGVCEAGSARPTLRRVDRKFALTQPQHIKHIKQSMRFSIQEFRGANGAYGIGGAACGLVGDFDALAGARKNYRVIADDVATAKCGESDFPGLALAGVTHA